jgi:hypothetical protein
MAVRAKFQLISTTDYHGYLARKSFKFVPQYDPLIPEDQRFMEATSSGAIEMYVTNSTVFKEFKNGDFFYVDFNKIEKSE